MIERVRTGIPGFDEIVGGGIPKRNAVLLSGGPGTGKTIFAMQYLWNGLQVGEPGVYVALEEHSVQVRVHMRNFGWDVRQYEQEGKFAIVDAFTGGVGEAAKRERYVVKDPDSVEELVDILREVIKDAKAERVVVDRAPMLYLTNPSLARSIPPRSGTCLRSSSSLFPVPEVSGRFMVAGLKSFMASGLRQPGSIELPANEFSSSPAVVQLPGPVREGPLGSLYAGLLRG